MNQKCRYIYANTIPQEKLKNVFCTFWSGLHLPGAKIKHVSEERHAYALQ